MATLDRIDLPYTAWTPSAAGLGTEDEVDEYIGRHRRSGLRRLALMRMFYTGKHRAL